MYNPSISQNSSQTMKYKESTMNALYYSAHLYVTKNEPVFDYNEVEGTRHFTWNMTCLRLWGRYT